MGKKLDAALFSVGVNILLLVSKIIVAFLTGSISLYAESAHSMFDLVSSILAYVGIKKAQEPSDDTHHFGHEKFENLSSLAQTLLLAGTGCIVIFESYQKILAPTPIESPSLALGLMIVSIPITYFTSRYLADHAKEEHSSALEADSTHFLTDSISSIAVLIGLAFAHFGYSLGDPLAAFAVGLIMLYLSIDLGSHSFRVFMDFSPDEKTLSKIESAVNSEKRITRFHKLRARLAGKRILVEVHIQVPHDMDIITAHNISHDVEKAIIAQVPLVKEVTVHIEPD
ncbi:cation transporter [Candidatus Micrarchaeota archaeon]|nr:cation transporter [Candidatus Micrarchaeota archaeon]